MRDSSQRASTAAGGRADRSARIRRPQCRHQPRAGGAVIAEQPSARATSARLRFATRAMAPNAPTARSRCAESDGRPGRRWLHRRPGGHEPDTSASGLEQRQPNVVFKQVVEDHCKKAKYEFPPNDLHKRNRRFSLFRFPAQLIVVFSLKYSKISPKAISE